MSLFVFRRTSRLSQLRRATQTGTISKDPGYPATSDIISKGAAEGPNKGPVPVYSKMPGKKGTAILESSTPFHSSLEEALNVVRVLTSGAKGADSASLTSAAIRSSQRRAQSETGSTK
jgi:hypothetical protein